MVIVKIKGGLGNQMFQYALARSLSMQKKTSLYLDLSFFDEKNREQVTKRNFELSIFNVEYKIAPKYLLFFFNCDLISQNWLRWILKKIARGFKIKSFIEDSGGFSYSDIFQSRFNNIYLDGYWQSDASFCFFNDCLKSELLFKYPISESNKNLLDEINANNSVAIHVRRGDYVTNKNSFDFHGVCSIDYYKEAIHEVNQNIINPIYYIFSDDTEWVGAHINFISNYKIVHHNTGQNSFEDLRLMMACKSLIIANSSFSWWAAWLNQNQDKRVIAPKKWFNNEVANSRMILPTNWMRI